MKKDFVPTKDLLPTALGASAHGSIRVVVSEVSSRVFCQAACGLSFGAVREMGLLACDNRREWSHSKA